MDFLDFKLYLADLDIWMYEAKKLDGAEYWEYILLCTDDTLVISDNAKDIIKN